MLVRIIESNHLQYVDETRNARVVVVSSRSDNWNFGKEKAKSRLSRRKAPLTRHINVAENLLKSSGSRRKLGELAAKIEEALKEVELASEGYELLLGAIRIAEAPPVNGKRHRINRQICVSKALKFR